MKRLDELTASEETGLARRSYRVKFWTRKKLKGCNALKRKINPKRVLIEEKENYRWLENLRQSTARGLPATRHCPHCRAPLDVLPALKDGDSFCKRGTSAPGL